MDKKLLVLLETNKEVAIRYGDNSRIDNIYNEKTKACISRNGRYVSRMQYITKYDWNTICTLARHQQINTIYEIHLDYESIY